MRVFQNSGLYPKYLDRLNQLALTNSSFASRLSVFLNDRFGALHFLKPVLDSNTSAFFTNGDDEVLQRAWAAENGMPKKSDLADILLAQIEHHRADVFYNLDPMRYGNAFLAQLPGCVKRTVAWRAAPSVGGDFGNHNIILNNFPSLLQGYRDEGVRAEYFTPAHDPVMDSYAANTDRPIDILFVGGYSRHHRKRAAILEAVAKLRDEYKIVFHLDRSRMTRLAETPVGWIGPLAKHRRPKDIRAVSADAVFGLDLYAAISKAKIVINGAVDMAGKDRGNMRCWEAMGCGAVLLSDAGHYPEGMIGGETLALYDNPLKAVQSIHDILQQTDRQKNMTLNAGVLIRDRYNKAVQWEAFQSLCN
jgi:hypothetical protein